MIVISFIGVAGISVAVFTIVLIFTKEKLGLADRLLGSWLLALVLNQLYFLVTGIEQQVALHPLLHFIGVGSVLLHAPLLFIFSRQVFSAKLSVWSYFHFAPFMVFMVCFGMVWWINPDSLAFRNGFIGFKEDLFPINYYGIFLALVSGLYTILAFYSVRHHEKQLSQTQSSEIRNVLNWLKQWIIAATIFFVATYLYVELSVSHTQVDARFTFQVISVFMSIYIFYVSYWGIRKTDAFRRFNPGEVSISTQANQANHEEIHHLAEKLKDFLEREKLFLDPDLSLTRLAEYMKVPPGKLSLVINQILDKNFYDLINEYRVNEFLIRLPKKEYGHLSLLGLAFECGFRSKSTFNAFFKRQTGSTPSAYKKYLEKESG